MKQRLMAISRDALETEGKGKEKSTRFRRPANERTTIGSKYPPYQQEFLACTIKCTIVKLSAITSAFYSLSMPQLGNYLYEPTLRIIKNE